MHWTMSFFNVISVAVSEMIGSGCLSPFSTVELSSLPLYLSVLLLKTAFVAKLFSSNCSADFYAELIKGTHFVAHYRAMSTSSYSVCFFSLSSQCSAERTKVHNLPLLPVWQVLLPIHR